MHHCIAIPTFFGKDWATRHVIQKEEAESESFRREPSPVILDAFVFPLVSSTVPSLATKTIGEGAQISNVSSRPRT